MDAITSLFRGPRASGAFLLRMVMSAPWSVDVRDEAPLTVAAVVSGKVTITSAVSEQTWTAGAGHVIVVRGPDHYRFFEGHGQADDLTILPRQHCVDRHGRSMEQPLMQGVRTWGNDPAGATTVLVGTYESMADTGASLLSLLPPVFLIEAERLGSSIVELMANELGRDVPGQDVVLDRLLDLLTVAALRAWFEDVDDAPGWWEASSDPVIGPALRLLQHQPAHPWTISTLAAEVGVSRATLARRFSDMVGAPPMAYLTEWRMRLAADLLLEPSSSLDAVAREVGYGSGFALSAAFKRWNGRSPSEHRAAAASTV